MPLTPSADPKDFPVFGKMSKKTYEDRKANLLEPLYQFVNTGELVFDWKGIEFDQGRINKILDMVQRREVYFHVYHDIEMGELNEACLNCFWIMKFCPFRYPQKPSNNINLIFALALFTRAITHNVKKKKERNEIPADFEPNFTPAVMEHLTHAFLYRDLSKEALMAIATSLAGF